MTVEERDQVDSVENSDIEFDDWNEVLDQQIICPFTERTFDCYDDFLANCRGELGMDFEERIAKLDFYSRIGFVNWARIHKRVPDNDEFLQEAYLKPVLENDCLLQMLDCDQAEPDAYEKLQQEFKEYKNMVENTFMSSAVKQQLSAIRTETPTITDEPAKPLDYYFGSYCETAIHQTMLKDEIRTLAYRDFCYDNKDFLNGKVVLDVGCGTGILSMFCAKMGAKVYAVDNSTVIQKARQIAAENNLADRITFIQGQIEDIEIGEQVDIIISEWMGYFLLFEGMLDSVLYARDKWLKPGGMMAPNKAKMLLACMTDEEWYNDNYHYWNDVYGFKMTSMKSQFITDATVEYCNSDCLDIDTERVQVKELDFSTSFEMQINKTSVVHAFCGWFDIVFDVKGGTSVSFSTSCEGTQTHWKQTVFVLESPMHVTAGDIVSGDLKCSKNKDNHRELDVVITWSCGSYSATQKYQVR